MKKFTFLMAMVLGFALNALALNPYAYGVSATINGDMVDVSYSINAAADSAQIVVCNNGQEVATIPATASIGANAVSFNKSAFAEAGEYTIAIRVFATSVEVPTKEATTYSFWSPYSIVIDKDPASANFGRLLITEAQGNVPASGYHTSAEKSGVYAFNPDFTPVLNEGAPICYKGGLTFTNKMGGGTVAAYSPIRLAISEDGRIFAGIQDSSFNATVYELSQDLLTWTPVISGIKAGNGTILNEDSTFLAGMVVSMDVKGAGENLKLLIYSCNMNGIAYAQSGYRLDEYALGTASTFTGTPNHIDLLDGSYAVVSAHAAVYYDRENEGGFWFTANRGGNAGQPNLAHWNAQGVRDYYSESTDYYGGAGLAQYAGKIYMGGNTGFIQAYTATADESGMTIAAAGARITTGIGRNVNAIEFDYAGNMYACSNSGEKLAVFAMPYSGQVTTPATCSWTVESAPLDAPNVAAPAPTVPADQVKSLYSDAYDFAPASLNSYNEGWWENPALSEGAISGDHYLLYTMNHPAGMIGWQFGEIACVNMEKIHIDIFPSADGTIDFCPLAFGASTAGNPKTLTVTAGHWNSFDLDLSEFGAAFVAQLARVAQVEFMNYASSQTWFAVDNVYLYTTQAPTVDAEAPTALTASLVSASYFSAELTATASDNSGIVIFSVYEGESLLTTKTAAADAATSLIVQGLTPGASHTLTVKVSDETGNEGPTVDVVATTLAAPAPAAAPTRAAEDVKAIYSDVYTPITSFGIGGWGQSTVATEIPLAANDHAYLCTNSNYLGWEMNNNQAIDDMSEFSHFHMDVYVEAAATIGFTPIWGDEAEKAYSLVAGWNAIDIDLVADFAGINLANIYQLKWANMPSTCFIDNVYFYAETTTPSSLNDIDASSVATKVIENGHVYIIKNGVRYTISGAVVE